jgi:hypothetical protein
MFSPPKDETEIERSAFVSDVHVGPSARLAARFAIHLFKSSTSDPVEAVALSFCLGFTCTSLAYFVRHEYPFLAGRVFAPLRGGLGILAT